MTLYDGPVPRPLLAAIGAGSALAGRVGRIPIGQQRLTRWEVRGDTGSLIPVGETTLPVTVADRVRLIPWWIREGIPERVHGLYAQTWWRQIRQLQIENAWWKARLDRSDAVAAAASDLLDDDLVVMPGARAQAFIEYEENDGTTTIVRTTYSPFTRAGSERVRLLQRAVSQWAKPVEESRRGTR